ncbi:uncharacterized protein B0I36DRAFT_340773, partial [Microdochium trichocladiopsis]
MLVGALSLGVGCQQNLRQRDCRRPTNRMISSVQIARLRLAHSESPCRRQGRC